MKVVIGKFARETFFSKNPQIPEHEALNRVEAALIAGPPEGIRQGYREGVLLVAIEAKGFVRRVKVLEEGDYLFGRFKSRVEGEAPRKKVGVLYTGPLPEAKYVDAVLYAKHVLEEDKDSEVDPTADYEVVTFLAKDIPGDEPMDTETLLHNHFLSDGGTSTKMADAEFLVALKNSFEYWKNRAHID